MFIFFRKNQTGVASSPTILILMTLIISVGVLIASLSFSDQVSVSGLGSSGQALAFARSGAQDALEKIARDKDYSGSYVIGLLPNGCVAPFAGCANVNVVAGNPINVESEGQVGEFIRKIQVLVTLDSQGLIVNYNWQEE